MTKRMRAAIATFAVNSVTTVAALLPILVFVTLIQSLGAAAELWMLFVLIAFVGYVLARVSEWAVRVETSLHRRFPEWWRS